MKSNFIQTDSKERTLKKRTFLKHNEKYIAKKPTVIDFLTEVIEDYYNIESYIKNDMKFSRKMLVSTLKESTSIWFDSEFKISDLEPFFEPSAFKQVVHLYVMRLFDYQCLEERTDEMGVKVICRKSSLLLCSICNSMNTFSCLSDKYHYLKITTNWKCGNCLNNGN